ncbi:ras GTPase-activating protein 1 isoform X2 [Petromyzon marinus]|uniref:ras GTPase-activating protein 1 isoform X2 n=1 Tax=Petromyzon marinus TaxID=7757 RepID=UPI003F701CE9
MAEVGGPGGDSRLAAGMAALAASLPSRAAAEDNGPASSSAAGGEEDGQEFDEEELDVPLEAPPQNQWYHGKLDRSIAEERLQQASRPGSYLVRESDRQPGSFVLSFLGKTGVNHFRIIAMCGDYYIGGRRFSSLSDLIGYYSHVSCLLKGEQLLYPVPPPEPVEDRRRVRAILPYTKVPETDELSFVKGDVFIVHNTLEDGWLWVTNLRTSEHGVIVEDLVEEVASKEDPHEGKPWFHGKITKQEAYTLLMSVGKVCSFLVRPSDSTPGDYSLYFRTPDNIQRFKIQRSTSTQFSMGGRYYNSIDEIINHYKQEQIVEGHNLKEPVPVQDNKLYCNMVDGKDIYRTIRERQRDTMLLKNVVKKGYLLKKGKSKRWKSLYFVLGGNDAQLFFFESEKRATKPKGLIDLSICSIYAVHESFFGRPHCFQIVVQDFSEENDIFYFAAETQESAQEWMKAIQQSCAKFRRLTQGSTNKHLRQVRSLTLYVEEAHKLPAKHLTHPYCTILLNNVQVARTPAKEGQNPVWAEEFVFDDLPPDIDVFEIVLSNRTKKYKDPDILFMCCPLKRLQNGHLTDEWFQLTSHVPLRGVEPGSLRVKARYSLEVIMPEDEYADFRELLQQPREYHVVQALSHVCGQDRSLLASTLLRVFRHERQEVALLRTFNDREISMEEEAATLFRATTLASTLMEQYMKSTAWPFIQHALRDTVLRVLESRQSCELNPSKLEKGEDVNANLGHLLALLSELIEKIFLSTDDFPIYGRKPENPDETHAEQGENIQTLHSEALESGIEPKSSLLTLRFLFGCLQKSVQEKWPANETMRTRVVSGFVFLRLICPAILTPKAFGIISDPPSPTAVRTLLLAAKSLQNLANLVEFGAKEAYMEGVNPFIKHNRQRMVTFLDKLANVQELCDSPEHFKTDVSRDLAALHNVCVCHLDELRTLSNERGVQQHALKKLLAITEMLQQKQNHYLSMGGQVR